uniref:Uncharacterized protein n=1 Tax=Romanomermis culicivorax TaxID=13658 RepID=A0A915JWZ1_ROMCU
MLVNLDSNVVDIKAMNANISPDGIFSSDIKPIKKPNDYPDVYGDLQSEPVLKIFNPSSGTFMSQPCSMPWMVHFQLGKDKICAGILISKNDIIDQHHNQPIDESIQYILTTASCAKDV